jgi:hypothetical protein
MNQAAILFGGELLSQRLKRDAATSDSDNLTQQCSNSSAEWYFGR